MKTAIACLVAFALSFAFVAFAFAGETPAAPVAAPVPVMADPLPIDLQYCDHRGTPDRAAPPVARPATMAPKPVKVWTCGAPGALASDATATVRRCEWL